MKTKARALFIDSRTRKGKKQFYLYALEYLGSRTGKKVSYPELSGQYTTKATAKKAAMAAKKSIEKRAPSVQIITRFL